MRPGSPVDMGKVTAHLQDVLPEDAILTNGVGNFTVWPNKFFKFGPQARLLAPQSGAMGYGVPAAIAAKVADPARTVVCFAGDGDFQMNCQELATAAQAGAQPIILILNNGIYGTIRAHQERHYPARVSGTDMGATRISSHWPRPMGSTPNGWSAPKISPPHSTARWRRPPARCWN